MAGASRERTIRVDPETLARLPSFYAPVVSPDGSEVAFYHDRSGRMELYTLSLDDGEWTQWSDGNVPTNLSGGITWGSGSERIYFHRDEDGNEQNDVHSIARDGSTEAVIETDGQAFLADVSPDGRKLLYTADEADQLNLHQYDLEGGTRTQLTSHRRPVWPNDVAYSPDGSRIAYGTNETDDPENRDVYVVEADGGDPRRLDIGEQGAMAGGSDWFPDGNRLLVGDNTPDLDRVGVYDLRDDTVSWLGDGSAVERPVAVSPDGDRAVVTRTRRAATVPVVYTLDTGEDRELDLPVGEVSPVVGDDGGFVDDDRILFVNETGTRRSEIVAYDLATDATETLVAADYGEVDPDVFVEPEYLTYESEDGLEIGALLYETRDEPGPAVVKVHGGPTGQSKRRFDLYAQLLATQGYTVLDPNYRGSTGRGREFMNAIRNDWGGMEQVDVRCGAEVLAERNSVDPDRIAVFGGSYGGYSAYCQLTMHPEPWAAGVAWIGMTDLLALHEESMPHMQSVLEDHLGDPEENADLYRERSPVNHVENIESPVYVIQGENDPRSPVSQAEAFRDALETQKGWTAGEDGEFEYTVLTDEGHASTDVEQKVRAFDLMTDFLDRRL